MEIGKKIIKYRRKNKLSQEQFAEKIGVTRQTISNWELNITKPDIIQIKNISKVLNTSIDDLLDNNGNNSVRSKINNMERELNKNNRNLKMLIIPVYFIILTLMIGVIIYYLTKKDFTEEYEQLAIVCTMYDETFKGYSDTYYLYWNMNDNGTYSAIIELTENNVQCDGGCPKEEGAIFGQILLQEHYAGTSLVDAVETIDYIKRGFLHKGATCSNIYYDQK